MKFLKALAATACAFALASAVQAATYTDSSENYEYSTQLLSGPNRGSGFEPWEVEKHGSGDGWAGFGVWDPSANGFQGKWAGKTKAFGIIGKGAYAANATRRFRKPLAVGDSFSLDMAVNWDPNSGIDALKGFALTANSGETQVLTVNHLSNPGDIAINGKHDSDVLNAFGTFPITWKFTAKDATTITVQANSRDDDTLLYEKDWSAEDGITTSAIDGFRLQSSNQNAVEQGVPEGENPQDWADRRQTYFDNFTLDLVDELPARETVSLEFVAGDWQVYSVSQSLSYTVKRSSSSGALDVAICSDNEAFVHPATASFADGKFETTVSVPATITGSADIAHVTASADGCSFDGQPYEVKGPRYRMSVETSTPEAGSSVNFWVNWEDNGVPVDQAKVSLASDPSDALSLPDSLSWTAEEGGAYAAAQLVANASGTLKLFYDDVQMANWWLNVPEPVVLGFELTGPATAKTGDTKTYTLKATLDGAEDGCTVIVDPASAADIDPASFELVEPSEDGCFYQDISVTFKQAGKVTLAVSSLNYDSNPVEVTVSDPVDPSKFDDYVAYDDASLYGDDFDYAAVGAGSDKFQAWQNLYVNSDGTTHWAGATLVAAAGDPSVLTDGRAFAIYSNGSDDPEIKLLRPFVNALSAGQAFSVVIAPNWRDGDKSVILSGAYDGNWYDRIEFLYKNVDEEHANDGYLYKVDYGQEVSLGWSWSVNAITMTVQCAADGSSYTLSFAREGEETVTVEGITLPGTIDGVVFRSKNGGNGDENNLIFNKLAIEQVEEPVEPVVKRNIGIMGTWNPDATGDYDFYVGPSEAGDEAIGTVNLTVTPDDGRIAISPTSVEVPGDNVVAFTVTVNSLPAEGEQAVTYTIKATPVDEMVNSAEFNVTPAQPYVYLSSDNNQLTTDDGPIGLVLHASPARYGEYRVTTDDDSVFSIPENYQTVTLSEEQPEATFFVDIVGPSGENGASIYATLGEGEAWCDYRFWVSEGPDDPYADILRIIAMDKADPNMVLTVDGTPATAYGATEIVGGDWAWQPLDDATIAGDKVTVPMTGRPYLIIKVEK